mmetsp:Transcript_14647/g.17323  ORF Transcript_14647/g.17323 Transcript_14647/m.17323 type:complete len:298 (+) Transcript_14647:26-919(+)
MRLLVNSTRIQGRGRGGYPSSPNILITIFALALHLSRASVVLASFSFCTRPATSRSPRLKTAAAMMSSTTANAISRNVVGKLTPATTAFFLCDIQERFRPLMHNSQTVISTAQYLTSIANTLDIPIVATEQYSKVFGPTVSDCFVNGQEGLNTLIQKGHVFEKKKFSMLTDDVLELLNTMNTNSNSSGDAGASSNNGIQSVVLFGIESHVCVQQTCLDLIEMGKDVHVIVDCVSSQQPLDRDISLQRMANAGAFLTTSQSLAYMLVNSADHPNFKAISKLTVEHMKLPNEFNDSYKK